MNEYDESINKRQMIDRIRKLNPTAQPAFLADFGETDLLAYLHQLTEVKREQLDRRRLQPAVA